MRKLTESGEEFDARDFFMGALAPAAERGFAHSDVSYSGEDEWYLDKYLPFRLWIGQHMRGGEIYVTVDFDDRMNRRVVSRWSYSPDQVEAAFAQVDRLMEYLKRPPGDGWWEQQQNVWKTLPNWEPIPTVGESEEDYDEQGQLKPAPEDDFDPREYVMGTVVDKLLKAYGYKLFNEDSGAWTKMLLHADGRAHFLTVYTGPPAEVDGTVIVEYQRHDLVVGYSYPWSARVDVPVLRDVLPVLESAIKSAWEQKLTGDQLKQALDALVK